MSDTVTCIQCAQWSLRKASESMAKRGWGVCSRDDLWVCYAADKPRQCEHFTGADGESIAARKAWLESRT